MSTGVPSCEVRHVLLRQDARDDALVAVAPGHLVADLELALDGDVDLHHLDDARRQLVALGEAIDLVAEVLLAKLHDLLELADLLRDLLGALDGELASSTCAGRRRASPRRASRPSAGAPCPCRRPACRSSSCPTSCLRICAVERVAEDLDLLVAHLLEARALLVLDVLGALVLLGALAGEDARVDDDARRRPAARAASCRARRRPSRRRWRAGASPRGRAASRPSGVILPTRMSPGFTSAPMRTMPDSSRSLRASSPTFGMSRVTSSLPSFVSRATHSNSSMWIEVKTSSLAMRSETRIESSKL